jgi:molecular chaperone HscC
MPRLGPLPEGSQVREVMRAAAERTRRALTDSESAPFKIVWDGKEYETEVTADEFEQACEPLIRRLRDPVLRSLRDSGIRTEELSDIILVGGSTRMPVVRRAVTRMFGRFPSGSINPDHAVALGAGVQAGLKARDEALDEIRLTDVCPFTLGVDTAHFDSAGRLHTGVFAPIIERNTVIPASRIHIFSTIRDNQDAVEFGIYQGEARNVASNVKLGQLTVPVPRKPAGHVLINCRFSYDVSGLLEVDVTIPETGVAKQLMICDDEDAPSSEEIEKRRQVLAGLKVHPRDEAANAAALARAERCYESFLGDRRDHIGAMILNFEAVLEKQEPRAIQQARTELEQVLNALEGERFL